MSDIRTHEIDRELLETAAGWRLRIEGGDSEPDAAVSAAFNRWLAADPSHAEAFDRTAAGWDLLERHSAAPEVIRARRDALDYAKRTGERRWGFDPARRASFRIAASIAVAAALGAVTWPMVDGKDVYRTGVGERRQVTLADGSRVALDSNSKVSVRYTDETRRLTLERGQARFDVAHNPYRPFSVTAEDRTVVATGTAFNIDIFDRKVEVTLIEGSVVVRPAAKPALLGREAPAVKPVALKSGQQLAVVTGSPAATVHAVKTDDATAWERGKLIFDDVPLAEAASRVNRYAERKVVIRDPEVAGLNVSGVFQTGDADAFARAMAQYLDLQASFSDREVILAATPSG
jgi:transmembrane sensor